MTNSTYFAPLPLFTTRNLRTSGRYLIPKDSMARAVNSTEDLICPLVVDTEFTQDGWEPMLEREQIKGRRGVTVQVKGIHEGPAAIFDHPDHVVRYAGERDKKLRHHRLNTPFAPVDYLKHLGVEVNIYRKTESENIHAPEEKRKRFEFCLYAHFALAELFMITIDQRFQDDLKEKITGQKIQLEKRLRAKSEFRDSVAMPWRISIGGHDFDVYLSFVDTCFIHNSTDYKHFCEKVGVPVEDKKELKKDDKRNMDQTYFKKQSAFDKYAIGDLRVYDALEANAKHFKKMWNDLGIGTYWEREPHLTMGASVNAILVSNLLKLFGISPNDREKKNEFLKFSKPATVEHLKTRTNTTEAMLSKIDGGRCRHNRPTLVNIRGTLVDIDLSSCYGESMRNQIYPVGRPLTIKFDQDSTCNKPILLKEFLRSLGWGTADRCELVPGLWFARVSTPPGHQLRYAQDVLASWYDWKKTEIDNFPAATTHLALQELLNELDGKSGTVKIFTHEAQNAIVTHDFVQWAENICGQKQRSELLNNLFVQTAILYPKSARCDSTKEFLARHESHQGSNTCEFEIGPSITKQVITSRECYAWYGITLGKLIVNDLVEFRKCYRKKTSLNELYKLCVNSVFGVCTSKHMKTSNVVVGNNLTARARFAIWYVEKGLHCIQTITDGGVFDLNNVVHKKPTRSRVLSSDVIHLYRKRHPNVRLGPLGNRGPITHDWQDGECLLKFEDGKTLKGESAEKWVNSAAWDHLRAIFPNVDVLHQSSQRIKDAKIVDGKKTAVYESRSGLFEFEMKNFYDYGHFHASANYLINNSNLEKPITKFRSHNTKEGGQVALVKNRRNRIEKSNRYENDPPAIAFLKSLAVPNAVPRADVFIRSMILKVKWYNNAKSRFDKTLLVPGDNHYQFGLIREFSLSQFTFRTIGQFKKLEKQYSKLRFEYGQSFEAFFLNQNDPATLNFQEMVETMDSLIVGGCSDIRKKLDKHRHLHRFTEAEHPGAHVLKSAKALYQKALCGFEDDDTEENHFDDLVSNGLKWPDLLDDDAGESSFDDLLFNGLENR